MLVGCSSSGVWCVSGHSAGGMAQTATEVLSRCSCEVWSHDSAGNNAGAEQSALRESNGKQRNMDYFASGGRGGWVLGEYGRKEAWNECDRMGHRHILVLYRDSSVVSDRAQAGFGRRHAGNSTGSHGLHAAATATARHGSPSTASNGAPSACFGRACAFLRTVRAEV
jgi:hypothetical protein